MPPRSKALATAAAEAVASSTLRRSSRKSTSSVQSTPGFSKAFTSSLAASTTSASKPQAKRPRIKTEPDSDAFPSHPEPRANRAVKIETTTPVVKKEDADDDKALDIKPNTAKKARKGEPEIFPDRPSPYHSLSHCKYADRRLHGLYIGAHISSAGGVENAPLNALRIGGNAFSCFVRPKMQWASNPISQDSTELFKERISQYAYMSETSSDTKAAAKAISEQVSDGFVVPHGCYLVNLANPDPEKREKSFEAFMDDLQRCEQLGIKLFNFHPGSMTAASALNEEPEDALQLSSEEKQQVRASKREACKLVASYINRAHSLTSSVIILIENMAGSKNDTILGSSLHDLAVMLSHVDDKARVGVCIDTCHAFAAGYDLTTPSAYADFFAQIESTIGWEKVKAMHLNDSKFALGCKRDRHENIGRGHIGLDGFWNVVNDERWRGIPLILETPAIGNASAAYKAKEGIEKMHQVWSYQIKALYALRGTKWGEWKEAEEWLAKADAVIAEAEALWAVKKAEKGTTKKATPAKGKWKKKKADSESEDDEESDLSSDE